MDGYAVPKKHAAVLKRLNRSTMVFTDHGNVSSHVQLEKSAIEAGLKPVFGLEGYCAPENMREMKNQRKWHLTILAANAEGYHNLLKMTSISWELYYYRFPTIIGGVLWAHKDGLVILSGCADSMLACAILGGKGKPPPPEPDIAAGRKIVEKFARQLGENYYIETQYFEELERTRTLNPILADLAREVGVGLAATADVHHPLPEENEMRKILHAAGRGNVGSVEKAEAEWEYDIPGYYPTSDRFVYDRLLGTGLSKAQAKEAILNTATIADLCDVTLPKSGPIKYPIEKADFDPWD